MGMGALKWMGNGKDGNGKNIKDDMWILWDVYLWSTYSIRVCSVELGKNNFSWITIYKRNLNKVIDR